MPRLVRKAPLAERLKAYLDPMDWLMWASEELNSNDWDEWAQSYATPLGLGMNIVFMIAKANAGKPSSKRADDVFSDPAINRSGWWQWFMGLLVLVLTVVAFSNGIYTFYRKRHYRLFEQSVETQVSTPSARRVRVDSSPSAVTPFRFIQNMLGSESAESRAHPDVTRDVWEIAVWDPNPLCLQLFCLFSPLHVILYSFNLPVAPLDPQPSVKVVTTIAVAALLTAQLYFLRACFSQQIKDSAIIQKEVLHEYDNKFVHPILQRPSRDVGIQTITTTKNYRHSGAGTSGEDLASEVVTYTPTTILKRNFQTHPNQAYASQYDPDNFTSATNPRAIRSGAQTPSLQPVGTAQYSTASTATTGADFSSPIRPSHTPNPFRQPQSQYRGPQAGSGDGGSLGVYSHAASPLRKSASANYLREERSRESLGGAGERRSQLKREGSPLKRSSTPGGFAGASANNEVRASGSSLFGKGYTNLGVGRRESGRF